MLNFTNDNDNTHEISDDMLIYAIARGATWAMEPLVERYNRYLYSLIYHMVSDVQIAEDLTQEVFVLVWRRAALYSQTEGIVRRWLTKVARNRTIDYLRSVKRHSVIREAPLEDVDEQMAQPAAEEDALRSIQAEHIRAAVNTLSSEQRMVIELAYFQGWTQSKIAEQCNIPLGTVKARIRLGTNHLKRALEQIGITKFDL